MAPSIKGLLFFLTIIGLAVFLVHWASRKGSGDVRSFVANLSTEEAWAYVSGVVFSPLIMCIMAILSGFVLLVLWLY